MKGIDTKQTSLGWNVFRVHYSADPAKNPDTPQGKEWVKAQKKGMSEAQWSKEMEIDFGALSRTLIFPEWDPSIHLVDRFDLSDEGWTVYMACDPHPRTPHAFLWLAVNAEGDYVVPFAWWPKQHVTVREYAESIKQVEDMYGFKTWKYFMDCAGKGMNVDEERNFFDGYRECGIYFYPAMKNRDYVGFDLIRRSLLPTKFIIGNEESQKPRLTVMKPNDELAWQIGHLRYQEWKGAVADKESPEKPVEKRGHLVDCLSYLLLEKPMHIVRRR